MPNNEELIEDLTRQLEEANARAGTAEGSVVDLTAKLEAATAEDPTAVEKRKEHEASVTGQIEGLTAQIKTLTGKNDELTLTQQFPDIPVALLSAGDLEGKRKQAEALRTWKTGKPGAPAPTPKPAVLVDGKPVPPAVPVPPDPSKPWEMSTAINPALEIEEAAKAKEAKDQLQEKIKSGDVMGVVRNAIAGFGKKLVKS